jgi:hypothetical protein
MTDLRTTPTPARTVAATRADHLQLARKLVAEGLGTAFLVAIVIGSGIYASGSLLPTAGCSCWRTRSPPAPASSR